jgi:hypothetical protein
VSSSLPQIEGKVAKYLVKEKQRNRETGNPRNRETEKGVRRGKRKEKMKKESIQITLHSRGA